MLYVSNNNSLVLGDTTLMPGTKLPTDHNLTEKRIEEYLRQGHLVTYNPAEVDPEEIPKDALRPKIAGNRPAVKWPYDPDGLKGRSLEELNGLIANIDPSVPAFAEGEEHEAVALLSMDFVQVSDIE